MKIKKIPKFPRFPTFKFRKRKKLRATAVRRPLRIAATAEYDDLAEPNMKLSRALLIVLLLHVVAVSGIIAFNAIKTREAPTVSRSKASSGSTVESSAATRTDGSPHVAIGPKESSSHEESKSVPGSNKQPAGKIDHGKSAEPGKTSGKVYVVTKGDNPVSIAKKLKVSYDELLALNHIDDPRKLQIGQKLLVPAPKTGKKKSE